MVILTYIFAIIILLLNNYTNFNLLLGENGNLVLNHNNSPNTFDNIPWNSDDDRNRALELLNNVTNFFIFGEDNNNNLNNNNPNNNNYIHPNFYNNHQFNNNNNSNL